MSLACSRTRSSASSGGRGPARTTSWVGATGPHARSWAGESQYYVEPKRLARLGYLSARREPGKTRERTVYTLTDKGLAALREYGDARHVHAAEERPSAPAAARRPRRRAGDTGRVVGCARSSRSSRSGSMRARRRRRPSVPGSRYLLLVISFLRRYLDLHADLVDEVERESSAARRPSVRGRDDGEPHDGVEAVERRWAHVLDQVRLPGRSYDCPHPGERGDEWYQTVSVPAGAASTPPPQATGRSARTVMLTLRSV